MATAVPDFKVSSEVIVVLMNLGENWVPSKNSLEGLTHNRRLHVFCFLSVAFEACV